MYLEFGLIIVVKHARCGECDIRAHRSRNLPREISIKPSYLQLKQLPSDELKLCNNIGKNYQNIFYFPTYLWFLI